MTAVSIRRNTLLHWVLAFSLALGVMLGTMLHVDARHPAPPPPTGLVYTQSNTNPVIHTLSWQGVDYTHLTNPTQYYVIFRNGIEVARTAKTSFQLNTSIHSSGTYTVRHEDSSEQILGIVMQSGDSNSVYVNLGYAWQTNGSPWNSCFTPNAPVPAGLYDGCFSSGSSMYALRNINVKYSASTVRSGTATIRVDYKQKTNNLPTNYSKYDVNVIVGAGASWHYITTLQMPAAGPGVAKSHIQTINVPIDYPGEVELQWVNDVHNSSGDANLQIDKVSLNRP